MMVTSESVLSEYNKDLTSFEPQKLLFLFLFRRFLPLVLLFVSKMLLARLHEDSNSHFPVFLYLHLFIYCTKNCIVIYAGDKIKFSSVQFSSILIMLSECVAV